MKIIQLFTYSLSKNLLSDVDHSLVARENFSDFFFTLLLLTPQLRPQRSTLSQKKILRKREMIQTSNFANPSQPLHPIQVRIFVYNKMNAFFVTKTQVYMVEYIPHVPEMGDVSFIFKQNVIAVTPTFLILLCCVGGKWELSM